MLDTFLCVEEQGGQIDRYVKARRGSRHRYVKHGSYLGEEIELDNIGRYTLGYKII